MNKILVLLILCGPAFADPGITIEIDVFFEHIIDLDPVIRDPDTGAEIA